MPSTQTASPIKGSQYAEQLARVCAGPLPRHPLEGLKYRRILLPGMVGGELYFSLVGMIGQALRIRGAEATALLCDRFLPGCTLQKVDHFESACTRWCHKNAGPFAEAMALPHHWYGEFITEDEIAHCDQVASQITPADMRTLEYLGIPLGRHIALSVESFFKVGSFDPENPAMLAKARGFVRSAMYLTHVGLRAVDRFRIDKVLLEDGKKVNWGVIRSVAFHKGIPVDCIRAGLRGHSIRFEYDRPPEAMLLMPEWENWKHLPLTAAQETALDQYLARREKVPFEHRGAEWQAHLADLDEVRRRVDLPAPVAGRVFSMFPNVSFDAGLTSTTTAFKTANEWIAQSIRFIADRPEHHLLVKVHPAECRRNAQDPLIPYLTQQFPALPPNVHLVPPDSGITAQAIARLSDWVLVYTSTVSVEAAAIGKPVMLVGGGWNSGRGFTQDIRSAPEYFEKLSAICSGQWNPPHPLEMARRYAYAFFFRSNIPVNHYSVLDLGVTSLNINSLEDLAPGRDRSMDTVCRTILYDAPGENPDLVQPGGSPPT
jgi:hypothetical protein